MTRRVPLPLAVAAALSALEGAGLLLYGILLVPSVEMARIVMGATSVGFFLLYGGFLVGAAYMLVRGNSWAWAPLLLAQGLQITVGLTWGSTVVAVGLGVPAAIAAVALLLPSSRRVLFEDLTGRWTGTRPGDEKSGRPD